MRASPLHGTIGSNNDTNNLIKKIFMKTKYTVNPVSLLWLIIIIFLCFKQ